jgi:RimJ/RimL family protein N-acetyltransferase
VDLAFAQLVADERRELAGWLASERWPFHALQEWAESDVLAAVAAGEFTEAANRSFWVVLEGERVGLLRFRYLDEPSPDVDVRVLARFRGRGIGTAMVEWAAAYAFTETDRHRLCGETRIDNVAMRRVFERCGWIQEAHYRASWPDGEGGWVDSVGYATLRSERRPGSRPGSVSPPGATPG